MEGKVLPPVIGTTIKIAVAAELGKDIHMVDVNFSCVVYNNAIKSNSITLQKSDMIYVEDDLYLAVVDTSNIGTGEYYIRFSADIPDSDCVGGIRKEIVTIPTGIKVNYR